MPLQLQPTPSVGRKVRIDLLIRAHDIEHSDTRTVLLFDKRQLHMGNFLAVFMPVVLSTLKSNSQACSVVRVGGYMRVTLPSP